MIFLNSKNKDKYNLDFFSLWAGVDKQDLKAVLEGISYLKVQLNNEGEKSQEQIKIDILKFQFWLTGESGMFGLSSIQSFLLFLSILLLFISLYIYMG